MFINGRFLTQRTTGVQRFAREIVRASVENGWLSARLDEILVPPCESINTSFAGIPVRRAGRLTGHAWEQIDLAHCVGNEFLLNFCNSAPVFHQRQLVVLHDATVAAMPKNFTLAFRMWYKMMIGLYGRHTDKLATVSAFSAGEIARYFDIPRDIIHVIPESGEHILRELPDYSLHEKFSLEEDGYFLAASSLAPNKNFSGIFQAIARLPVLPFKFVIVGGRNAKVFNAGKLDLTGAIEVGYVTDAQLRALYDRAACFVYPSTYEGFGLPPLEALSCGCPVLVSNATSLPEICGSGAAYCDPYDPEDIAKQLRRLLVSKAARDELRKAGLVRAREWTWSKAALQVREIISH